MLNPYFTAQDVLLPLETTDTNEAKKILNEWFLAWLELTSDHFEPQTGQEVLGHIAHFRIFNELIERFETFLEAEEKQRENLGASIN